NATSRLREPTMRRDKMPRKPWRVNEAVVREGLVIDRVRFVHAGPAGDSPSSRSAGPPPGSRSPDALLPRTPPSCGWSRIGLLVSGAAPRLLYVRSAGALERARTQES